MLTQDFGELYGSFLDLGAEATAILVNLELLVSVNSQEKGTNIFEIATEITREFLPALGLRDYS